MGYVLSQISPDERSSGKYHYSRYYYSYGRRYGYGYGYGYGKKSSKYSKYIKPVTTTAAINETAIPEAAPNDEK